MRLPSPPVPDFAIDWALFLDVDGTLLELAPTPDAVQVPSALISLLLRLQHRLDGAIALVSGRRIAVLDNFFKPLLLPTAGLHGFECRDARGLVHAVPIDPDGAHALQRDAREIARAFPGVLFEDKEFSVAFHYGAIESERTALRVAAAQLADRHDVELLEGRRVYELKPANVNKRNAIEQFLAEPPFVGRRPIFLGDDHTDEPALAAVRERGGLAIQVDHRIESDAEFGLPDPHAVWEWLHSWEEHLSMSDHSCRSGGVV